MRRYFQGIKPGDLCTGTVHRFGLSSRVLLERKIISPYEIGPYYEGGRLAVQGTSEWVFNGIQ